MNQRTGLAIKAIDTAREALAARALWESAKQHVIDLDSESTPVFWSACNALDWFEREWYWYTKQQELAMVNFVNTFPVYTRECTYANYLSIARRIVQKSADESEREFNSLMAIL